MRAIRIFGTVCFVAFLLLFAGLCASITYYQWILSTVGWNEAGVKGPLWYALLPQVGIVLGASLGGWVWARNWIQKQENLEVQQETADVQRQSLAETKRQFSRNLAVNSEQFERRLLEERFNRVLDDLAKADGASRAGAASRLADLAQTPTPTETIATSSLEIAYPLLIPTVRQLVQRLAMDGDERVGAAVRDAIVEVQTWLCGGMAAPTGFVDFEGHVEKLQVKVIEILAEANRGALSKAIEAVGAFADGISGPLDRAAYAEDQSDRLGAADQAIVAIRSRQGDIPDTAVIRLIKQSRPIHRLESIPNIGLEQLERTFNIASSQLVLARDVLAACLQKLPPPLNMPHETSTLVQIRESAFVWHDFRKVDLTGCFLAGAVLDGANLQGCQFTRCFLEHSWIIRANLTGCSVQGTGMDHARLEGTTARGIQVGSSTLNHCDLHNVNLAAAMFMTVDLSDANLWGTNLEEAVLIRARLHRATMWSTNLKGARFESLDLEGADVQCDLSVAQGIPPGEIGNDHVFRHEELQNPNVTMVIRG